MANQNAVNADLAVTIGLDFSFIKNLNQNLKSDLVTIEIKLPNIKPVNYGWVRHDGKQSSQIAKTFMSRLTIDIYKIN